jgi:hypothetical protein
MNLDALKLAAIELRSLLQQHQNEEPAAASLLRSLSGLIEQAIEQQITSPMEARDIPGHRCFTETPLGAYHEIEQAFAAFYIELIDGRSSKAFQMLQAKMNASK